MSIAVGAGKTAGGGGGTPPPTPLSVSAGWQGSSPYPVSGASGGTGGGGYFQGFRSGGVDPVSWSWTVESNPSGKLGLSYINDAQQSVGYSGFALNETQSIAARVTLTDSAGATATYLAATSIKRTT